MHRRVSDRRSRQRRVVFSTRLQHDPSHSRLRLGDYPKFALWISAPGGAYYLTVNLFIPETLDFRGVRVFALDRASDAQWRTQPTPSRLPSSPTGMGDSYSLVAANFRTGDPPPAGETSFSWPLIARLREA